MSWGAAARPSASGSARARQRVGPGTPSGPHRICSKGRTGSREDFGPRPRSPGGAEPLPAPDFTGGGGQTGWGGWAARRPGRFPFSSTGRPPPHRGPPPLPQAPSSKAARRPPRSRLPVAAGLSGRAPPLPSPGDHRKASEEGGRGGEDKVDPLRGAPCVGPGPPRPGQQGGRLS